MRAQIAAKSNSNHVSKDKHRVKVDVLYQFNETNRYETNNPNFIQFQLDEENKALLAINPRKNFRKQLKCEEIFQNDEDCSLFFETGDGNLTRSMNTLLKGYNSSIISIPLSDQRSTRLLFGRDKGGDSNYTGPHLLSTAFQKVNSHLHLGAAISIIEIKYDADNEDEILFDLLTLSTPNKEAFNFNYDFSGITKVYVKSVDELETIISIAEARSVMWKSDKLLRNASRNDSSIIYRMTFNNGNEQFSFSVADLSPIHLLADESRAYNQLNNLLEELVAHRDNVEAFRLAKLSATKILNLKTGNYGNPSSEVSKIVGFLSHIVLASQTSILVPVKRTEETIDKSTNLELFNRLNEVEFTINKEPIDNKKANLVNYQFFTKSVGGTEVTSPSKRDHNYSSPKSKSNSSSNHKSSLKSPEIYIENETKTSTPSKKVHFNITTENTEESKKLSIRSPLEKIEEVQEEFDRVIQSKVPFDEKMLRDSSKIKLNDVFNQLSSPKSASITPKSTLRESSSWLKTKPKEGTNYFADYNANVSEVLKGIETFMVQEVKMLTQNGLPHEYYDLRRHFDILYRLFKDGESVKLRLAQDFGDLGRKIEDFKSDYDRQLQAADERYKELESRFNILSEQLNLRDLFEIFERDVLNAQKEAQFYKTEYERINSQLRDSVKSEAIFLGDDSHLTMKKYHLLLKQNDKITRLLNDREQEIIFLRKRERQFTVEKKLIESAHSEFSIHDRKIAEKDSTIDQLSKQNSDLDRENKILRQKLSDLSQSLKKSESEYNLMMDKISFHKQMSKPTMNTEQSTILRDGRDSAYSMRSTAKLDSDTKIKSESEIKSKPEYESRLCESKISEHRRSNHKLDVLMSKLKSLK